MAIKRKTTTAVVAGVTAAALLLGGTFAWTSISQTAKNEAIVDINPGGRLHDDFDGKNKDVYVENFSSGATGVNIFARIRLDQYFEVGQDAGINKEADTRKVTKVLGDETDINDVDTWITYLPTVDEEGNIDLSNPVQANDNWQWTLGNDADNLPYYMPTFNKNKDSLKADINGTYEGTTEGDIVHFDDFVKYGTNTDANEIASLTKDATYDWDDDTVDEENPSSISDRNLPIDTADVLIEEETHTATPISTTATVISMAQWLENPVAGNFWVYDEDGWAYWAQPIAPETTTGLLLDSISMSRVPDDNWYYGINVVGQFATASDWEMFFAPEAEGGGESMTDGAKQLMALITETAASSEDEGDDDDITENGVLTLDSVNTDMESVTVDSPITVEVDAAEAAGYDISDITVSYTTYADETDETGTTTTLEKDTQYTYSYDEGTGEGTLTITDASLADMGVFLNVKDNNGVVFGDLNVVTEGELPGSGTGEVPLILVNDNDFSVEAYFGSGAVFTLSCADTIDGEAVEGATLDSYSWPANVTPVKNDDGTITVTVGEVTEAGWIGIFASGTVNGETVNDSLQINLTPDLSSNGISIYLPSGYAGGMSPGFGGTFTADSSDVTWSISGNQDTDTQVLDATAGAIAIGNNETADTITLTATSTTDSSLYGTYKLKIITDNLLSISHTEENDVVTLVPYDERQATQNGTFSDTYSWTVSPESGLEVAENGTLTATAAGTYTVTATSNSNYKVTASVTVTVADDLSITVTE